MPYNTMSVFPLNNLFHLEKHKNVWKLNKLGMLFHVILKIVLFFLYYGCYFIYIYFL